MFPRQTVGMILQTLTPVLSNLLEGYGPLALDAYKILQTVCTSFAQNHHPNMAAVARRLAAEGQGVTEASKRDNSQGKASDSVAPPKV